MEWQGQFMNQVFILGISRAVAQFKPRLTPLDVHLRLILVPVKRVRGGKQGACNSGERGGWPRPGCHVVLRGRE